MRARYPDREGRAERNGAEIHYEVYEADAPTVFLVQTWHSIHSRHWKMQIPYLSRSFRVVTYDPAGNGRSDRPDVPSRYSAGEMVADAIAVLDASDTPSAVACGLSMGGALVTYLAALHPERIDGIVPIAAAHPWAVRSPEWEAGADGWDKYDPDYWPDHWPDFVDFFFGQCTNDPHSTKLFDDMRAWALDTTGDIIRHTMTNPPSFDAGELEQAVRGIDMPVLVVHGTNDAVVAYESAEILRKMIPGSELVRLEGAGHVPNARYPVRVNHLIRDFVERVHGRHRRADATWRISSRRPKRALYISSPIGLGHARRDLAIARELAALQPELQIDWLAQDPVTRVLDAAGETVHPASQHLASEVEHIDDESGEHELAVFQALRDMDEILLTNFMVVDEVVAEGQYDLVIGDEAWEVDYHLHENPGLKKAAYAWMTDFVGYLPMPERGEREAFVAADYNAEMIGHIERYGRIRDGAIFVGAPDDIVPGTFGPGLPNIRDWTEAHYDFAGYVTGFDPSALPPRGELRDELGYRPDERVCVVSVGGSGVGGPLLRRIVEAAPEAARTVDGLRFVVVTGPRIDPAALPQVEGVEYHRYVPELYRNLAAADLAIVQGGLTTTMELTACKVPFVYVPLRNHFEQQFHVRARLDRYRAGRHLAYEDIDPDALATVVAEEIGREVDYRDVETDGAARAASLIAQLV
ncbi:MAG: alpha/beta fold hydrolase [Acidimicrobiia bacterium]|nr:alpha/beta fold hydrolase [Acidimicrobiia bacterium]